jgi:thioredoxin reductase
VLKIGGIEDVELSCDALIIATGAVAKWLGLPSEEAMKGHGVSACATCDGFFFRGKHVAVIGGGNAGFESAAQLLAYCKSVTLIHRNESFDKADASTVDAVLKHPNMHTLRSSEPIEVKGGGFVSSIVVKNRITGEVTDVPAAGIFVEIGMIPSTTYAKDIVALDPLGRVPVDPKNQRTATSGVWAAGDCTDELYHQNNIAAGDAVKALEDIYFWLKAH